MSNHTERQPINSTGRSSVHFVLHLEVLKDVWGQILKDTDYFSPAEAERFVYALNKLGYRPSYDYMTEEYHRLVEIAKTAKVAKEPEPTVPHHYLASLYGGSGGIYVSLDKAAARREAELDAGRGNIMSFRPATENEVAWHKSMGGRINHVEPVPTAPATEGQ